MLFQKQGNSQQMFSKLGRDQNLFRKIDNTSRKIDNSVMRVGAFIKPVADMVGAGGYVNSAVNGTHAIRNSLEKAIHTPVNDLRTQFH
jgi:hypothetical protein